MRIIRAKFEVIERVGENQTTVILEPRYDESVPEDQRFSEATPWGKLEMFVNNPTAIQILQPGQKFYLDLIPITD